MAATDNTIFNKLLSFLKGQINSPEIGMYPIVDGLVDDFNDDSGVSSIGPFITSSNSSIISGIAVNLPSSSCLTTLLHFDGVHESTTTFDHGPFLVDINSVNLLITTESKKFGSSSGYFNGSATVEGFYDLAYNINANENFTIEYFMNMQPNSGGYRALVSHHSDNDPDSSGYAMYVNPSDKLTFEANYGDVSLIGNTIVADEDWHHVAIVRSGSNVDNLTIYFDGEPEMQTSYNEAMTCGGTSFKIGTGRFYTDYYTGYIDEVRVVRNWPVYSSSFIPPVAELSNQVYKNLTPPSGSLTSKFVPVSSNPASTYVLMIGRFFSGSLSNLQVDVTRSSGSQWLEVTMNNSCRWLTSLLGLSYSNSDVPLNVYVGKFTYTPIVHTSGTNTAYRITSKTGSLIFNLEGIAMYSE